MSRHLLSLLLILPIAAAAATVEVPTGTQIQIRLTSTIDSNSVKPKQPFEAVVIAAVFVDGRFAIPQGAQVRGLIKDVKPSAKVDEQTVVTLEFQELRDPHGFKAALAAQTGGGG